MHAYIRFRERPVEAGPPPLRRLVRTRARRAAAGGRPFRRPHGQDVTWMIATPEASVLWDGATLHDAGPLMSGPADLDDAGEALWLTYYRSIFNPARLNAEAHAKPYPVALLEEPARGRAGAVMVSQAGARRAPHRPGRRGGPAPRHDDPDRGREGAARPRAAVNARRMPALRTVAARDAGRRRDRAGPRADHARRRAAGRPGGSVRPAVRRAGRPAARSRVRAGGAWTARRVYLTNAVKHFKWEPRGKRRLHKTPAQKEIEACHYWLEKEIATRKPKVIVAMGATALKSVLQTGNVTLRDRLGQAGARMATRGW